MEIDQLVVIKAVIRKHAKLRDEIRAWMNDQAVGNCLVKCQDAPQWADYKRAQEAMEEMIRSLEEEES